MYMGISGVHDLKNIIHHIAHGFNRGFRVMQYGCEMATGVCEHDSQKYRPHHIGPTVETVGYMIYMAPRLKPWAI